MKTQKLVSKIIDYSPNIDKEKYESNQKIPINIRLPYRTKVMIDNYCDIYGMTFTQGLINLITLGFETKQNVEFSTMAPIDENGNR